MEEKEDKTKQKTNPIRGILKKIRAHRLLFYSIITFIVLIFLFFATNSYLYINFILGNDVVVKLSSDNENFNMVRGEEKNISFRASITTNPFCTATCTSKFEDISTGRIIENKSFSLNAASPMQMSYRIMVTDFGEGQKLYREDLECQAQSTFFCHTSGDKTSRNILVTVEYHLSDKEKKLKEDLKNRIENLRNTLDVSFSSLNDTQHIVNSLDKNLIVDDLKNKTDAAEKELQTNTESLLNLNSVWEKQDYQSLDNDVTALSRKISDSSDFVFAVYNETSDTSLQYANLIDGLNSARLTLEKLNAYSTENISIINSINRTIKDFNDIIGVIAQKDTLTNKNLYLNQITNEVTALNTTVNNEITFETLRKLIDADIEYNVLCVLNQTCIQRPNISERLIQTVFNINDACRDITAIKKIHGELVVPDYNASNTSALLVENAVSALSSLRQYLTNQYILSVSNTSSETNNTNFRIILSILSDKNYSNTSSLPKSAEIPFIVIALTNDTLPECSLMTTNAAINELNMTTPTNFSKGIYQINFTLSNLTLSCCVYGVCKECCASTECLSLKDDYPVVFLHGHSFNKAVAADYSLDAFNKIQNRLESDGYLNAGAVSLYTPPNMTPGTWGMSGVPISVKASYYFDIFQEPQNYVVVQTKSENIDTYSIRLSELIKTIKYRTGKDKVILITHSMGGLVARRYIQVFGGADVDKLIMIGAPNHGIKGNIADYCSIIGSTLECNDMNSESLFINKVNHDKIPSTIDVYNIVGVGCSMSDGTGDGVVLKDYSTLDYAKNFYVNGSCSGLSTLHTGLLDIDKYPQVYDIIKQALRIN